MLILFAQKVTIFFKKYGLLILLGVALVSYLAIRTLLGKRTKTGQEIDPALEVIKNQISEVHHNAEIASIQAETKDQQIQTEVATINQVEDQRERLRLKAELIAKRRRQQEPS